MLRRQNHALPAVPAWRDRSRELPVLPAVRERRDAGRRLQLPDHSMPAMPAWYDCRAELHLQAAGLPRAALHAPAAVPGTAVRLRRP